MATEDASFMCLSVFSYDREQHAVGCDQCEQIVLRKHSCQPMTFSSAILALQQVVNARDHRLTRASPRGVEDQKKK